MAFDDNKAISDNDNSYIINNQKVRNEYSIYLDNEIGEQKNYRDILNQLREMSEDDSVKIFMSNGGGEINTGIDLINAIRKCKAYIVMYITGPIYSMASLIALSAPRLVIEDYTYFMFHDYSSGNEGKGHELQSSIINDKVFYDNMLAELCKGFLTKKEIKNIHKGMDLYIERVSVIKRLKKLKKLVEDK